MSVKAKYVLTCCMHVVIDLWLLQSSVEMCINSCWVSSPNVSLKGSCSILSVTDPFENSACVVYFLCSNPVSWKLCSCATELQHFHFL